MKKLIFLSLIFLFSCAKPSPSIDYTYNIGLGVIIAKESCTGDDLTEYWVVDLNHPANQWKEGDSLFVNGIQYTNVVKIIISNPTSAHLKKIGQKVSFRFEKVVPPQNTRTCTIPNSVVYPVKQVTIQYDAVADFRG